MKSTTCAVNYVYLLSHLRSALYATKGQASPPNGAAVQQAQAVVETNAAEVKRWAPVHSAYRHHLETMSLILHLWRLVDAMLQTTEEVERQLQAETRAIEAFVETHGLPVKKQEREGVIAPFPKTYAACCPY